MHEAIPARSSGTGGVRAFRRTDIPAVVALRRQLFRSSEHASAAELEAYVDRLFFTGPVADEQFGSLVYEDEHGELTGFLGIVPRRMLFGGKPIRAVVGTQFMVAPQSRGFAARKLARAFISGPQDLTLSDAANDGARGIWSSVGGRTSIAYSLSWTCPLRPLRFATMRAAQGSLARRGIAFGARPLVTIADAALAESARSLAARLQGSEAEPLDVQVHLPELSGAMERWALRPRYMNESLQWVLGHVATKQRYGPLQQVVVRDKSHRLIGWFLYCLNRGGVSTVVQLGSVKGATDIVLARMMQHARERKSVALTGRFEPSAAQALSDAGATFKREGPWLLYHSRHPGIECAIEGGDAFISRLDGEWWMGF